MLITRDTILDNLTGEMTASKLAERLGVGATPVGQCAAADLLPTLEELRSEGRVTRRVDAREADGVRPVVRWRAVG